MISVTQRGTYGDAAKMSVFLQDQHGYTYGKDFTWEINSGNRTMTFRCTTEAVATFIQLFSKH